MTDELVLEKMRVALFVKSDANDLIHCVIALNTEGVAVTDIYRLLEVLRNEFTDGRDEVKEDAILDTMDYVWKDMKM